MSGLRGACYATFCVCERVGLLGAVGVWARVLPFGRTGALPSGGQYSRVECLFCDVHECLRFRVLFMSRELVCVEGGNHCVRL